MNARVFLLLLVTALFMAAWNSDQAAEQQFLAQRARERAAMSIAQTHADGGAVSAVETAARTPRLTSHVPSTPPVVSQFRPDGMAAGVYRAVSEAGATFELTVASDASVTARDFYVADSPEGQRWYFIRVRNIH